MEAIEKGELSEDDEDHGPNFYEVNEQYVKPVTLLAGKMSWALMRNPQGVHCEIFISHAWQEGVFEFLEKLRNSWPWRMQHAAGRGALCTLGNRECYFCYVLITYYY